MRLPTLPRALAAGRRWWPMVIEIILAVIRLISAIVGLAAQAVRLVVCIANLRKGSA